MDETIAEFSAVTGATPQVARHFLTITDGDLAQAIQLFFDSPDLGSAIAQEHSPAPPVPAASTRPPARSSNVGRTDLAGVVHLDSDDEMSIDGDDDDYGNISSAPTSAAQNATVSSAAYEDDEAIARRMQEELYSGGDMAGDYDADGVRAPIARTTETLVGPDSGWQNTDPHSAALDQMRARQHFERARQNRAGVFNQQPTSSSSIWNESDPVARRRGLAEATGGASESNPKAAKLAELFRPPFELIERMPWDHAREKGKEEEKWILVNVQDPSIFECQALNRDLWKNDGIRDTVKENFIFMQYSKDDPAGEQYVQYYLSSTKDSEAAYPHIGIVDPRTGEQVKVWSGSPAPKAVDFLMQLYEFLDRYSLEATAKNPVAKRKAEKSAVLDVDKLTEEQMLDLALQNSLAQGDANGPKEHDPDELTKSIADISKGKGKELSEDDSGTNGRISDAPDDSIFASIPADQPHVEPANNPATTTRIQFRHSGGRVIRRFEISDPVRRIYEWLKSEPIEGKAGIEFELKAMSKDLIESLDMSIGNAGLKNATVMVEYLED